MLLGVLTTRPSVTVTDRTATRPPLVSATTLAAQ
jgi:hypothetical protein